MFIVQDLATSACRIRWAGPTPPHAIDRVTSEEKRHGSSRPGSAPRVSATGAPARIHRGCGAVAGARHRRQRHHLCVLRRFRPPPFAYPEPDRVVTIGSTFPRMSSEERFIEAISVPEFVDIQSARTIGSIAAFDLGNRNISGGDRPERVVTALAMTDLFGPFGLKPALGRGFTDEELAAGPGAGDHQLPALAGSFRRRPEHRRQLGESEWRADTVVGVMPPELLILGADLWLPRRIDPHGVSAQPAAAHVDRQARTGRDARGGQRRARDHRRADDCCSRSRVRRVPRLAADGHAVEPKR